MKEAVVQYKKLEQCPESVADLIDDMGFPSKVSSCRYKDVAVQITDMTCMKCVKKIEGQKLI